MALAHVVIFLGHGDWRRRRWPAGRRRPWSAARWLRMPQIRDLGCAGGWRGNRHRVGPHLGVREGRAFAATHDFSVPDRPGFPYRLMISGVYSWDMDVAVTDLRAHLSEWLERARGGDEIVITDHGVPVARLLGLTTTATLERLAADGVIGPPAVARRPRASGRPRSRPRRPLADIVSEQRR